MVSVSLHDLSSHKKLAPDSCLSAVQRFFLGMKSYMFVRYLSCLLYKQCTSGFLCYTRSCFYFYEITSAMDCKKIQDSQQCVLFLSLLFSSLDF